MTQTLTKPSGAIWGAVYMIGAGALFAGANTAVQSAGMRHGVPPPTTAFWQYAIAMVAMAPLILRGGWRTAHPVLHLIRVALAAIGVQLWVAGLAVVPIWQAIALILTSPLLVTLGAVIVLAERLTVARGFAVLIGAFGGVIILAPWSEAFSTAALYPVAAAAFWAASSLMTKRLARKEPAQTLTVLLLVLLLRINGLAALGTGFEVASLAMGVVALAGVFTALAQYLLARAYCVADAAYLQPFDHLKLPLNVSLGALVFGFEPPGSMWLGAGLMVAASAWLMRSEA